MTVIFDVPPGNDATCEYVVEERQSGGTAATWVEVAKGPKSPISYTSIAPFGAGEARVFVRVPSKPFPRDVATDTTAATPFVIKPGKPTNVKIQQNPAGVTTLTVEGATVVTVTPVTVVPGSAKK